MSSWLSFPLPNPFKSSDDQSPPSDHSADFSAIGQTIGRQLRGVAAFLAPPPQPASQAEEPSSPSQTLVGIKNDLVEIGGSFKSSLSLLSPNKAVKFASKLLKLDEEDGEEAAGITNEVVDFVRGISNRPECWIDFPLSLQNDFNLSETQREHAASIEHYVSELESLRHKVCRKYMSEDQFWIIYFILLLPRLDENDAALLSTPEIVEVREKLLEKLKNKKKSPVEILENSNSAVENLNAPQETKKPAEGVETPNEDNAEKWVENKEIATPAASTKQSRDEEEVSFSDLEDEDNDSDRVSGRLSGFRSDEGIKVNSGSESNEWVQLSKSCVTTTDGRRKSSAGNLRGKDSSGEESNDWLTVDDADF
jgi:hypothetical protein